MAKILMAVPLMIWFTLKRMARTARTGPSSPLTITATTRPSHRLSVMLAAMTATMAAVSIMPSMAMLTTPERSHSTPLSAAKGDGGGALQRQVKMPSRLIDLPRTAQTRKANTKDQRHQAQMPAPRARSHARLEEPQETGDDRQHIQLGTHGHGPDRAPG